MDLRRIFGNNMPGMGGGAGLDPDASVVDTAETIHISSLALLKMLKHGKVFDTLGTVGIILYTYLRQIK